MDESAIYDVCAPYVERLAEQIRDAFEDYDQYVVPDARALLLRARAKITNCCLIHRMAQRFGRDLSSRIHVQEVGGMEVVVILGDKLAVALRLKKYDSGYRVYNHVSGQQDALRKSSWFDPDSFPELQFPLAHVILGYRSTTGIQPKILDIALSSEQMHAGKYSVEWRRILWSPDGGYDPYQTFTQPMYPSAEPTYEIKPKPRSKPIDGTAG